MAGWHLPFSMTSWLEASAFQSHSVYHIRQLTFALGVCDVRLELPDYTLHLVGAQDLKYAQTAKARTLAPFVRCTPASVKPLLS